jgi:uncharacterized protein (DUF1697 family)
MSSIGGQQRKLQRAARVAAKDGLIAANPTSHWGRDDKIIARPMMSRAKSKKVRAAEPGRKKARKRARRAARDAAETASTPRAVLIRDVNVSESSIGSDDLHELMASLGARNVTCGALGNAAYYGCGGRAAAKFDRALERGIKTRFGFALDVLSRSDGELAAALSAHPYGVDDSHSQLRFLASAPAEAAVASARKLDTGADEWTVIGREWHVRFAAGENAEEMNTARIGELLGVAHAARSVPTVNAVLDLCADVEEDVADEDAAVAAAAAGGEPDE